MKYKNVVIASYARTPFGAFQGALSQLAAPKLGAAAISGALKKIDMDPKEVSEVIMGNVLLAGEGQAPARQAALFAGLPDSVPAMTVNKVCGSGMKSIMLGAQSIMLGDADVVVAGGMESMSQAPYLLLGARDGLRMGNRPFIDSMVHDGLWDPYNDQHMGNCGELCAREKGFSRKEQDDYAISSFQRAQKAWEEGKFNEDVVPVEVKTRKSVESVSKDEGPWKVKFEKVPELRPAFDKDGTVTAANSSTINDGAAVTVLMSEEKAKKMGVTPIARLVSAGRYAHRPEWFTTAPTGAMKSALEQAGWTASGVDLFEVNEAFAVVALSAKRDFEIPAEKLNVWGGAISVGHPLGASGTRIVGTLISALRDKKLSKGIAGICIGGGEATAICLEV